MDVPNLCLHAIRSRGNVAFSRVWGSCGAHVSVIFGAKSVFGRLQGSSRVRHTEISCFLEDFWHGYAKTSSFLEFQGPTLAITTFAGGPFWSHFGNLFAPKTHPKISIGFKTILDQFLERFWDSF